MMPFELRDYQLHAVEQLEHVRDPAEPVLLAAPTGSGKTIIACEMIRREIAAGGRCLFLAPRRELVQQTSEKLTRFRISYGVIMSGDRRNRLYEPVQVASTLTLHSRLMRKRVLLPDSTLVLVDEAHLAVSPTCIGILDRFRDAGAWIVGLTATPARSDGRALSQVFSSIVESSTIADLTADRWLEPAVCYAPTEPDLSKLGIDPKTRDYVQREAERMMNTPKIVGDVIEHWTRLAGDRRTVVFASSVSNSMHLAKRFQGLGIAAEHVDANTPQEVRDQIFRRFREGRTQILCNCFLAAYGFDLPELSCVVLARPTRSIVLYLQMIGRGLRRAAGKTDCLVIDHVGAIAEHGLVTDPTQWTLEGKLGIKSRPAAYRKKPATGPLRCSGCHRVFESTSICPGCGQRYVPKGNPVATLPGELVQVEKSEVSVASRAIFYQELKGIAIEQGYKRGWAANAFRRKFGHYPPYEWAKRAALKPTEATVRYAIYLRISFAKSRSRR